ncbi:MAG: phosphate starvation-inducible protein PhoH [Gammaproteobacteria bacterium]|nr:phosphate starvation-inducible protein PhoH [Gammaproteobacteria bacterium]|tara:strand:+ start:2221 stop:3201 length:981 start_codon:yes stop_codon:yes gene_type:complete
MKANKRSLADKITSKNLTLKPQDNIRLAKLCGTLDENLRQIESYMQVEISNRGNNFIIKGTEESVPKTSELIERLYSMAEDEELTAKQLHLLMSDKSNNEKITDLDSDKLSIKCKKSTIKPSSKSQEKFIDAVLNNDLVFGVGAAGTGKTFLAVAMAAYYLEQGIIKKIFLARPAIEAGEKLGFLPGDLAEKVNPYLQPVYDALNELVGSQYVTKLVEKNIIEIVPLAYMRGRTLNDAFIILDEAQNTTIAQMKMFLTRIGFRSKTVVTGDVSQVDLPKDTKSGLIDCLEFVDKIKGVKISNFDSSDVVRHRIVRDIINAYDKRKK